MQESSLPLFPPFCRVDPEPDWCTFLGIKVSCLRGLDLDGPMGVSLTYGHWMTWALLWTIGFWNLSYTRFPWTMRDSMKLTTSFYAIITGIFALCRWGWHISRPLLIGAAIHNICEWVMFLHVMGFITSLTRLKIGMTAVLSFFLLVIVLVELVLEIKIDILIEQYAGIIIDFLNFLIFGGKFLLEKNKETRQFYLMPAIATTIHILFTIIPLVYANFFVYQNSKFTLFMEGLVYVSAPITHILYLHWSIAVDNLRVWTDTDMKQLIPASDRKNGTPETSSTATSTPKSQKDGAASKKPSASSSTAETSSVGMNGLLPESLRIGGPNCKTFLVLVVLFVAAFFLAYFTLIGLPKAMGPCAESPVGCRASTVVYSTATVKVYPGFGPSFEELIDPLTKATTSFHGNLDFSVTKQASDPTTYVIDSKWRTEADRDAWLAGPVKAINTPQLQGLIKSGSLTEQQPSLTFPRQCSSHLDHGAFHTTLNSPCSRVWKIVSNWSDCSWLSNCAYAVVTDNVRAIHTQDGRIPTHETLRKLDAEHLTLSYEGSEIPGYSATITLKAAQSDEKCDFFYTFSINRNPNLPVAAIYGDIYKNRIPYLEKRFA